STSSAFGRPIAMLTSPVPLTSTCYVNIDRLTTEQDTSPERPNKHAADAAYRLPRREQARND
ncbi:hypothetical protein, partial [Burkholderia sp. BCC0398]|uniref:hypothetical protein n=1 Tax=Burkholderia sp. BCC0398 TaxID=2676297 RepID=UPI001ABA7EA6